MIELSSVAFVRADLIQEAEIYRRDDEMWYVRWSVEDGVIESEGFTGKIAARNYVKEIIQEIKSHE